MRMNSSNSRHHKEICFIQLPVMSTGIVHMPCCGKVICIGCAFVITRTAYEQNGVEGHDNDVYQQLGGLVCAFCREPTLSTQKNFLGENNIEKRADADDVHAISRLGSLYLHGANGYPRNADKALELWHRAGELGHASSYYNIGCYYFDGQDVDGRDVKKGEHYFELAAIKGCEDARIDLLVSLLMGK